jgi:hypothetical protein
MFSCFRTSAGCGARRKSSSDRPERRLPGRKSGTRSTTRVASMAAPASANGPGAAQLADSGDHVGSDATFDRARSKSSRQCFGRPLRGVFQA